MAVQRVFMGLLTAFLMAVAAPHAPCAQAQNGDLAALYQRWQQTQDTEQLIAIGEELLAREQAQKPWPLAVSRGHFKAELSLGLGSAYLVRPRGVRADNLERAIGLFDDALQEFTLEACCEGGPRLIDDIANGAKAKPPHQRSRAGRQPQRCNRQRAERIALVACGDNRLLVSAHPCNSPGRAGRAGNGKAWG